MKNRGQQVDGAYKPVARLTLGNLTRPSHEKRDLNRRTIGQPLCEQAVLTETMTIVRQEEGECRSSFVEFPELLHDRVHHFVHAHERANHLRSLALPLLEGVVLTANEIRLVASILFRKRRRDTELGNRRADVSIGRT